MLNCPRVTCSSNASMFACCSKRKFVTRAMTPVLSRPMTVTVANFFKILSVNEISVRDESEFGFDLQAHFSNFRCVGQKLVSLIGLVIFIAVAWSISSNRKLFPWRTVLWGLGLQFA